MIQIRKNGHEIRSIEDWFRFAPPMDGEVQWKDCRSAKELARAWFPKAGDPQFPPELNTLFASCEQTREAVWEQAEPERLVRFDGCGGNDRNADLVLWGRSGHAKVLASIEAKADEPFSPRPAGPYVDKCASKNPRSRVPERFALLCQGVLGVDASNAEVRALGYQLLTGVAGAICDAAEYGADCSLFIVHEFLGATVDAKVQSNAEDLNRFLRLATRGTVASISPGQLVGPLSVPGNDHFNGMKSLFIGKCRRQVEISDP